MTDFKDFLNLIESRKAHLCWGFKKGIGTYFTIEIGQPHLKIREAINSATSNRLKNRVAKPVGDLSIWVQDCDWSFRSGDGATITSDDDRDRFDLIGIVDGSSFEGVNISSEQIIISFDRGILSLELDGDTTKTVVSFFVYDAGSYSIYGDGKTTYE